MKLDEVVKQENSVIVETEKSQLESSALNEVKGLLEYEQVRDMSRIRKMSPHSNEVVAENIKGFILEMSKYEDEFKGDIIKLDAIKKTALKFGLRFLPSTLYLGSYDPTVLSAIEEFSKDCKVDLNEHNLTSKFFILAPSECFKLEKEEQEEKRGSAVRSFFRNIILQFEDPLLFYKVDDSHYKMIKKWGKDLTYARAIKAFFMKSYERMLCSLMVISAIPLFFLFNNIFTTDMPNRITAVSILSAALCFILSGIVAMAFNGRYNEQVWSSKTITNHK